MVSIRDAVLYGICALSLAITVPAQAQLTVEDSVLSPGETVEFTYSNPELSDVLVEVEIGGGDGEDAEVVLIHVDGGGEGRGTWSVSEDVWDTVYFRAPDAQEVACYVLN